MRAPLERESELDDIETLLDGLGRGDGRVLAVEGPGGIGKTTLLGCAVDRAQRRGISVLGARASELEQAIAYGIPRQWLGLVLRTATPAERERLLRGAAALAAPVLEDVGEGAEPQATMHGLQWMIANVAESAPVLLTVDDAQWADEASNRLLNYLAPRLEGVPVALLVACRPPADTPSGALLDRLLTDPACTVLRPAPLSDEGAGELLGRGVGRAPEPAFLAACQAATGGNPFLLEGLGRALADAGVEPVEAQVGRLAELRPDDLARGLLARVSDEGRSLARALAILDEPAELALAAALADLAEPEAEAGAAELARAGLIEDARPLRFSHPLIQSAVEAGLPAGDRAAGHAAAVALLRDRDASPERIAVHLLDVDPAGDPWVVETLTAAAETARRRGAPEVVVRLVQRALAEPPASAELEAQMLMTLGRAEHDIDAPDAAERLWEAAQRTSDRRLRAQALLAGTWAGGAAGRLPADYLRAVTEAASDPEIDRDTALLLEASVVTGMWLGAAPRDNLDERIDRLSALAGETPGECSVLAVVARLEMDRGSPAPVVGDLALRSIRHPGMVTEVGPNSTWLLHSNISLRQCELYDEVEELLRAAVDEARRTGTATGFAVASANLGGLLFRRGDVNAAEGHAAAALASGGTRGWYRVGATTYLIETLIARGRLDEALEALAQTGLGEEIPQIRPATPLVTARGKLRLALGELDEARADLADALDRIGRHTSATTIGLDSRLALAEADHQRGATEEARAQAAEAAALARQWGTPGAIGSALRMLGRVTGGDTGLGLLREAIETLERSPLGLELTAALVDLGAALRRGGARSASREPLRRAFERAQAGGATVLADAARAELAASGVRVRRADHRDHLTPSERRVAEMAADGMSNPQIAQALFVTTKTVESHLAGAYRKLDIRSRRDLPRALAASVT